MNMPGTNIPFRTGNPLSFKLTALFLGLFLIIGGCSSDPVSSNEDGGKSSDDGITSTGWLIPESDVVSGGPGKDGIPSIDNPQFLNASNVYSIDTDELVIAVKIGDEVRVYPHNIMNWHEIVNDKVNDVPICVTYCPLTGTAIGWQRMVNGKETTFGVSGLLYKNNLIPYDRETDSRYSQMLISGVKGKQGGKQLNTISVIETKWGTIRNAYPQAQVLSRQTGFDRNYDRYPYGSYKESDDQFLFPVENRDDRLPNKQRVHGIGIDSSYVTYPIKSFGNEIEVINDEFNGKPYVVFGSSSDNIVESYVRERLQGEVLTFEPVQNSYPVVMKSQNGTEWNIFGEAVSGPLKGHQLTSTLSYNGFWFAFADFFPGLVIRRP